ncbi:hypothetical protein FHS61_002324 [Altererythrobacter atlanticus]|uniref:Uncharacterized protein n=1 Tax=Croceibacterium atlanticum TaxID=1267766 RepID=A0A0F7KTL1_9SPHN|nr:hypothetical protein [Croceibacterium atlanticum]AKH42140.1 hypothetical protein WYH_01093 [Croceibacterium atlanticum]MBB5733289.1 hypothetical protein [Croceibacterium atlanticum]
MYESDDPRSRLASAKSGAGPAANAAAAFGNSTYARYYASAPQEELANSRNWYTRGQNFVVCYSEVDDGAVFERREQVDEYVLLLPEGGPAATVEANGERVEVAPYSITMVPPGDSRIMVHGAGSIVRLITSRSQDILAKAQNADSYSGPHPHVPEFEPWPEPADGYRIRSYSLDVPEEEGRFGKIFRCTTFMVNVFPSQGPRDVTRLSPHHHDDFEQCSLALDGFYMHHLRWPWTANQHDWREDEHELCLAPSVCVIPPRVIHTSAPSHAEANVLVDIFSPPREDFSDMPGWVLNADDYPRK